MEINQTEYPPNPLQLHVAGEEDLPVYWGLFYNDTWPWPNTDLVFVSYWKVMFPVGAEVVQDCND